MFERGDSRRLNPIHVRRIRRVLADLAVASSPTDLDQPGYRLHQLQGDMYDPPHPGEMIRDILEDEEVGWSVTECAQRLDVARNTLSRLLNGRLGISPRMALALEKIGWSHADHWMRLQAAYDLAQERRKQAAA